jgi:uncharacterized protein (DUF1800 family)
MLTRAFDSQEEPMPGPSLTRRSLVRTAGLSALADALPRTAPPVIRWSADAASGSGLPAPDAITFLVNRITFGATPEELARARTLGFEAYVEEQLHAEDVDDSAVEAAVAERFPTVGLGQVALEAYDRLQVAQELKAATVYRAFASRRQLFELMVDFWSNHFNVHHLDGPVAYFKTLEDRELIRRHALGRFRELLGGSAASPAMIVYLDNFSNVKERPNENYARELMELHTLGADGGFAQADVEEVARAFTGWTLGRIGGPGTRLDTFRFNAAQHDDGACTVLGTQLPAGLGIGHGERVLDLLAGHPSCARFIAFKLCRRFVSDDPPPSLVDRAAATFTTTQGDIREVLRTVLLSGEMRLAADRKLKRPLEFVVSALRTLNARLAPAAMPALLSLLEVMGQLPFNWGPPNGYPDVAEAWGNSNGLLDRWSFALALGATGAEAIPGVRVDVDALADGLLRPTPAELTDHLAARLLARELAAADRRQVIRYLAGHGPATAPILQRNLGSAARRGVSLLLASPYFQWR